MSGTSMDGVDAALIETDGERVLSFGPALTLRYTPDQRATLRAAISAAMGEGAMSTNAAIAEAEALLTATHAAAIAKTIDAAGLGAADIHYAGFHGQTVLHRPAQRLTWQIGDGGALAAEACVDIVYDFRTADVQAGGQGAPLVPLYHQALVAGLRTELPVAVLNIGGVANVTWVGPDGALLAFDTGPGNAALDDWALHHTGKPIDEDGQLAMGGRVDKTVLTAMLDNPWFDAAPPKSLDRMDFTTAPVRGLSAEDGAATLTAFTAWTVALAARHFPAPATRWLVCGGGRRNPVMMAALQEALQAPVEPVEAVGWRGDFLEAEAFAFLAARHLRDLPLSVPTTTGVPHPLTGGRLARKP
jgi:anhydro-N-acetylmuramic acid kinase